jgi:hypothetical protein
LKSEWPRLVQSVVAEAANFDLLIVSPMHFYFVRKNLSRSQPDASGADMGKAFLKTRIRLAGQLATGVFRVRIVGRAGSAAMGVVAIN